MSYCSVGVSDTTVSPLVLEISEPSYSMFNGLSESGFDAKACVIDMQAILNKEPLPRSSIGGGLYIETTELTGIYGRFATGFSHTLEYGPKGEIDLKFSSVQISGLVSDDEGASKKLAFNIYANGKIKISCGYIGSDVDPQPDNIRRFLIDSYTEKQEFLYNPIVLNNATCQFQFNGHVTCMARLLLECSIGKHGVEDVVYGSKSNATTHIYLKEGVKIAITKTGKVTILGVNDPSRLTGTCATAQTEAYTITQKFLRSVHRGKLITVDGIITKKAKRTTKSGLKCSPKKQLTHRAKELGVVNFRIGKHRSTRAANCDEIREMISRKEEEEASKDLEKFIESSDFEKRLMGSSDLDERLMDCEKFMESISDFDACNWDV